MRDCQRLTTKVIDENFLEATIRVPQVKKRPRWLVHAWIENNLRLFELLLCKDELSIFDLDGQPFLQWDHLCLVVFLDCLWFLEYQQAWVDLINVLVKPIICFENDQAVWSRLLGQVLLQVDMTRSHCFLQLVVLRLVCAKSYLVLVAIHHVFLRANLLVKQVSQCLSSCKGA